MATEVNPAALLRASTAADGLADDVRRESADIEADTASGVTAIPGFRTREALERLQYGWTDALARHRQYLSYMGDALVSAAHGYRRSDAETAASFAELDRF